MKALVVFIDFFTILAVALLSIFLISSGPSDRATTEVGVEVYDLEVFWEAKDRTAIDANALRFGCKLMDSVTGKLIPMRTGIEIVRRNGGLTVVARNLRKTEQIIFGVEDVDNSVIGRIPIIVLQRLYPSAKKINIEGHAIGQIPLLVASTSRVEFLE